MLDAVIRAFRLPDLRRKLLFTLVMLGLFRLIAHIPVPGVQPDAVKAIFDQQALLGMLDMFSGGAMTSFSIAAMGVYPYITATIIMQLLQPVFPQLRELAREGEAGRLKVAQYTRLLTVPLAALQAYAQGQLLRNASTSVQVLQDFDLFNRETFLPTLSIICTLTAGTMFLVWIGELITEKGIGNGISIIIFGGIVGRLPDTIGRTVAGEVDLGSGLARLAVLAGLALVMIAAIVYMNEGQRRIQVQYAKRIRGNRVYGGTSTYIPLRVNSAGMIPLIFATSIMLLPGTIATYLQGVPGPLGTVSDWTLLVLDADSPGYWGAYFVLVVAFTFFYTDVMFNQQNLPENLQKQGGFIPGIRAGRSTADYLTGVVRHITLGGALFLGILAILPYLAGQVFSLSGPAAPQSGFTLTLSTAGMLIVVGVILDTMKQLEAQLMMRDYEGFIP